MTGQWMATVKSSLKSSGDKNDLKPSASKTAERKARRERDGTAPTGFVDLTGTWLSGRKTGPVANRKEIEPESQQAVRRTTRGNR